MTTYKITTYAVGGARVQWFSSKSAATRYARSQVFLGYYPKSELVAEDYSSSRVVHFPSVAVKAYFSGLNF